MKLIIGGYAQGKLHYVKETYHLSSSKVFDGRLPEKKITEIKKENTVIINHLHQWIAESLRKGESPEDKIREYLGQYPNCVMISDEIGNGIVPIDAFEREYRERAGRILVWLAQQAEEVERVVCGLGQKIK